MNGHGWSALIALNVAGGFLLSQVFVAPGDLAAPRDAAALAFDVSYLALAALFLVAPGMLVYQFHDKRLLQTVGLSFGLWSVQFIGLIIVTLLSNAARPGSLTPRFAQTGEFVVLCFAICGFFLFCDYLGTGPGRRAFGATASRARESMRGRRRRVRN